jgi:hypothetical protein
VGAGYQINEKFFLQVLYPLIDVLKKAGLPEWICGMASRSSTAQCFPVTLTALRGRNNNSLRFSGFCETKFKMPIVS